MVETFKEISIGGLSKEELLRRLAAAGIEFNKYAQSLFEHPAFAPSPVIERVRLMKVKLSHLGLNNPCSYQSVIHRASELGLKLCSLDLAAFLRLEYLDQPSGPYLTIASLPPEEDEKYPTGFYIRNFENALWLRGYRVEGEAEWPLDNEFIFRK